MSDSSDDLKSLLAASHERLLEKKRATIANTSATFKNVKRQGSSSEQSEKKIELPQRTCIEIANPAPPGQRHEQAIKIAISLLGHGLNANAVFAQLRSMYDDDFSDREITNILTWAGAKNMQPHRNGSVIAPRHDAPARVTSQQAKHNAEKFLKGWRCEIVDLWEASPWRPCDDFHKDAAQLFAALYDRDDHVNVVTDFLIEKTKDGKEKACPHGGGITLTRDDWLKRLRGAQTPCSDAGCWMRMNPVKNMRGSGLDGAHNDVDVASHRFLLIESDTLSIDLQLSLWARLRMPVAALIDTAGRSVHAWLKVDCADETEYRKTAADFYTLLTRFGICSANKNPSRLSRLPGVTRKIGGTDDYAQQRLLYLNPSPRARAIFERS
jgi:hypothetical protein